MSQWKSARDVLRVMPVTDKRERKESGYGADHAVGLTAMKGEGDGKMIR